MDIILTHITKSVFTSIDTVYLIEMCEQVSLIGEQSEPTYSCHQADFSYVTSIVHTVMLYVISN